MKHQVSGLLWAEWTGAPTWRTATHPSPSAPARAGQAFERRAAAALPDNFLRGPWIHFEDATGQHWAQPDLVETGPGRILLLEVKLNFRRVALQELEQLYLPLLTHLFRATARQGQGPEIVPAVLCKRLTPEARGLLTIPMPDLDSLAEVEPWSVLVWDAKTPTCFTGQGRGRGERAKQPSHQSPLLETTHVCNP